MSDEQKNWTDEQVDWLTKNQLKKINDILRNTPVSALPGYGGSSPRVKTVEGIITYLDHIVTFLKNEMHENEELKEQIDRTERDLQAAGRIFARMGVL